MAATQTRGRRDEDTRQHRSDHDEDEDDDDDYMGDGEDEDYDEGDDDEEGQVTQKAVEFIEMDTRELSKIIRQCVTKAISEEIAPIVAQNDVLKSRLFKVTKALEAQGAEIEKIVKSGELIEKSLGGVAETEKFVKALAVKQEEKEKSTAAPTSETVTTDASEVMEKGIIGDPNATGAEEERLELARHGQAIAKALELDRKHNAKIISAHEVSIIQDRGITAIEKARLRQISKAVEDFVPNGV
jgi:hypothetical protein